MDLQAYTPTKLQTYTPVDEVEEGEVWPAQKKGWHRSAVGLLLVAAAVGLGLVVMKTKVVGGPPTLDPDETIIKVEDHTVDVANESSAFDGCNKDANDWDSVTSLDPSAQAAAKHAFQLLIAARHDKCTDLKDFAFGAEAFSKGGGHKHYLHVHHKFASDCKSETYKLHFFIGKETKDDGHNSSFVVQVSRDRASKAWQLLQSNPNPCKIQVGSAAAPQAISTKTKVVNRASKFALGELTYQLNKSGCLPKGANVSDAGTSPNADPDKNGFTIESVEDAVVTIMAGVEIRMTLRLRNPTKVARVIVFERCAGATECVRQLRLPGGVGVCDALDSATKEDRRLTDRRMGAEPDDPTEIMVAQRQAFFEPGRRLLADRAPLIQRHITKGPVSAKHDPSANKCFKNIAVYDQGSCGSCYANAIGQMMGIRKCMSDNGRRLIEEADQSEKRRLGQPPCEDSTTWALYGVYHCDWFAKSDPGCTHYTDYGQRAHCKKTCNTCPVVVNQNTDANPWKTALYKYMPSVNDLAQCATNENGVMQGCNGGNPQGVWNNWMRSLNRQVWVMGEQCKPYTMKCKSSDGVVNPLSGGSCSKYSSYQTWHRPCSCIADNVRPKSFQCPNTHPSSSCGFDVPPAFFTVSGMTHGLHNAEAVLNMQRHIAEFGPIYVSFQTTNAFMHWDWNKNPVYTGGSTVEGGHAVIAIGWGSHNVDYWLLRNSWGGDYASGGYMKFRRGVNLDGIEDSASASMPTSNFKDWSPPVCALKHWSYGYSTLGGRLQSYTLTMKVQCNKACSLKIFTSVRLTNRDQIKTGVSGRNLNAKITSGEANQLVAMKQVQMKTLDFGPQKGDMWVQIKADDGKGNTATSDSFVNIPQAPW